MSTTLEAMMRELDNPDDARAASELMALRQWQCYIRAIEI